MSANADASSKKHRRRDGCPSRSPGMGCCSLICIARGRGAMVWAAGRMKNWRMSRCWVCWILSAASASAYLPWLVERSVSPRWFGPFVCGIFASWGKFAAEGEWCRRVVCRGNLACRLSCKEPQWRVSAWLCVSLLDLPCRSREGRRLLIWCRNSVFDISCSGSSQITHVSPISYEHSPYELRKITSLNLILNIDCITFDKNANIITPQITRSLLLPSKAIISNRAVR